MSGTRRIGAACNAACNAHTTKKLWKAGLSVWVANPGARSVRPTLVFFPLPRQQHGVKNHKIRASHVWKCEPAILCDNLEMQRLGCGAPLLWHVRCVSHRCHLAGASMANRAEQWGATPFFVGSGTNVAVRMAQIVSEEGVAVAYSTVAKNLH